MSKATFRTSIPIVALGGVALYAGCSYVNGPNGVFSRRKLLSACRKAGVVLPMRFEIVKDWDGGYLGVDPGYSEYWTVRSVELPLAPDTPPLKPNTSEYANVRDYARDALAVLDPTELRNNVWVMHGTTFGMTVAKSNGGYVFLFSAFGRDAI